MNFSELKGIMDSLEEKYSIPAGDVSVYHNHQEVFRYSVGYADSQKTRPVSHEDIYILYSASKVITNTAVTQLIERGLIGLEDPVTKYLPEFSQAVVHKDREFVHPSVPITIRHLMSMTAGLTYNMNTVYMGEVLRTHPRGTTRDIMSAIVAEPLLFEPGTHFNYSLCHDVLGAVIEVASGMSFGEYLQKNIFDPLGMKDTTFHPTEEQKARISAQYTYDGATNTVREIERVNPYILGKEYESGGAGIFSTVDDYMKLASALANFGTSDNGFQVLKPESVNLMRTDQLTDVSRADFAHFGGTGKRGYSYGLGVRTLVSGKEFGFCTPDGEFGWDGAASAYVAIQPDTGTAIFFGMQVMGCGPAYAYVHPDIREAVFRGLKL